MAWLGERYVQELVPGARETVEALHRLGKVVYLVSGGLLPAVRHLSRALAIPDAHVFAVAVHFDGAGAYPGLTQPSPLARARWQGRCVQAACCPPRLYRHGRRRNDGYCRARGGAYVVGFGGVAYREQVAKGADCYIAGPELTATLEQLLSEEEREALWPRVT